LVVQAIADGRSGEAAIDAGLRARAG